MTTNTATIDTACPGVTKCGKARLAYAITCANCSLTPEEVKITYRGWPGHFCAVRYCVFRLNTLVECGDTRIVISTVGNMQSPLMDKSRKPAEEIGCDRYYETMAFHARWDEGYWETDVLRGISITGQWTIDHINRMSDIDAQEMHEVAVQDIISRIKSGEIK